jgi:hypothetical protein
MMSLSKSLGFLEYQLQNPFFVGCIDGFRINFGGEFQPTAKTAGGYLAACQRPEAGLFFFLKAHLSARQFLDWA